jgi:hypothetical protein
MKIVANNIAHESRIDTDESKLYDDVDKIVDDVNELCFTHESVKHADKEYARGDVTTNSVEGLFCVFKRGMRGTYQHCSEKHLHRYVAEFDFRFNRRTALGLDDEARCIAAIRAADGKRLTYHQVD